MNNFIKEFINKTIDVFTLIDQNSINNLITQLVNLKNKNGRLFILGIGGSAAHASHACVDFRKLCGIEAYAPHDNVPELTARTNDEGFHTIFTEYLKVSKFTSEDAILVISVGGGAKKGDELVSAPIVAAIDYVKSINGKIFGIVGKEGGHTFKNGDAVVIIPPLYKEYITPITEGLASVILHLIISHPSLVINPTKW